MMKIIVNQSGDGIYTIGAGQFLNLSKVEIEGCVLHSVGVQGLSFALYKKEKHAKSAFNAVMDFLASDTCNIFRFEQDKK